MCHKQGPCLQRFELQILIVDLSWVYPASHMMTTEDRQQQTGTSKNNLA